jgi:hypothetical protein
MNKVVFQNDNNLTGNDIPELAIPGSNEPIFNNAQPYLDTDSIRRFCQVWGEVGRAILGRRSRSVA